LIGENTTSAVLEGNALNSGGYGGGEEAGVDDLTLMATGNHTSTTTANGGSSGAGTVIGGAFALDVVDNETVTDLGTTGSLEVASDIEATATHTSSSTLVADASALGASTGIGAAIALAFVDNRGASTLRRDATAGNSVNLKAATAAASSASA